MKVGDEKLVGENVNCSNSKQQSIDWLAMQAHQRGGEPETEEDCDGKPWVCNTENLISAFIFDFIFPPSLLCGVGHRLKREDDDDDDDAQRWKVAL